MRILIYKRTHTGDPDTNGKFGVHDCMGQIREYDFDAVIGVGGIGPEPKSYGIDRKINWVGINAKKNFVAPGYPPVVTFEHYILLEDEGPKLDELAPNLAKKMYNKGARFILDGYTELEKKEANLIINWALKNNIDKFMFQKRNQNQVANGCVRRCCAKSRKRRRATS